MTDPFGSHTPIAAGALELLTSPVAVVNDTPPTWPRRVSAAQVAAPLPYRLNDAPFHSARIETYGDACPFQITPPE